MSVCLQQLSKYVCPNALKKVFHVPLIAIYIIYSCHLHDGDVVGRHINHVWTCHQCCAN